MVTEEREDTVNRKEGGKNRDNKGSHSHEEHGLSRIRSWAAVQLGQALGIACSGEQPGAPAPLACAERRISYRHLQGTAAQATEPDPRGAEEGMNYTFPAVQVWFTLILRAFPLSPNTACP